MLGLGVASVVEGAGEELGLLQNQQTGRHKPRMEILLDSG
jgi:hypothetical protein